MPDWLNVKKNEPEGFKTAIKIDKLIRNNDKMKNEIFLHRSLKPIDEVDFDESQVKMWGDCSGYCHI